MLEQKYLFEELSKKMRDYRLNYSVIPEYITSNLKFDLFDWQREAFLNFLDYQNLKEIENPNVPVHLMFNMATGTGKTLLMAALILYYYKQGHRCFIFFVNQNNIVGKTEENLINPSHDKYLFKPVVVIDDKTIYIKKVNNFADECDDIQIKFTSIQQLHNDVYKVKEDNVFLEDLLKRDLIMLGDEAHHLNAATKNNKNDQIKALLLNELSENSSEDDIEKSWEYTVIGLLLNKCQNNKSLSNNNALLEFTATVPEVKEVQEKYLSKIIYKFDLKDFLKAGYTKEINLVSSSFDKKKRILQALLFNWYRHKMAIKYNIPNFKPVILLRSKTIDESKNDYLYFLELIENLHSSDFNFLNNISAKGMFELKETYQKGQSRILDLKRFIDENNISFKEIIDYLKDSFNVLTCIITNSKTNKTKKEKTDDEIDRLLNSLENKSNHKRAIFTVQRLTEGWDVLNLFDIVRLYEGRDEGKDEKSGKRKAGSATVSEVQLIGRGVRYYPFDFEDKQKNKRKFDNDLDHDLRVLEEFYFHSDDESRYIDELKRELKDKGLIDDKKIVKQFQLKLEFQETDFCNEAKIYHNQSIENPDRRKQNLDDVKKDFKFEIKFEDENIRETKVNLEKNSEDQDRFKIHSDEFITINPLFKDFEKHIIRKAFNIQAKKVNSIFRYSKIKNELAIESTDDLVKDKYLGNLPLSLIINKNITSLTDLSNDKQLEALLRFLDKIEIELKQISNPRIGSEFEAVLLKEYFAMPKTKSIIEEPESRYIAEELIKKDWYVLNGFNGTIEEINLINFIKNTIGNFEKKYKNVYLLRNEEVYTIYDFEKGRGFQPDFILFLTDKRKSLYYQVFIEPKGKHLLEHDAWKGDFLDKISKKYGNKKIFKAENGNYKLIGLPLYNAATVKQFRDAVNEELKVEI